MYMYMSCMHLGVGAAVCASVYMLMFAVVFVDVCVRRVNIFESRRHGGGVSMCLSRDTCEHV